MFIPRTLAEPAFQVTGHTLRRAALVVGLLVVSLTAILGLRFDAGAATLEVGDVAAADIRAPRSVTFNSETETERLRAAAADRVEPHYVPIAPPADIRNQQLEALEDLGADVSRVLDRRDRGVLLDGEVEPALRSAAPLLTEAQVDQVAQMPRVRWEQLIAAAVSVVDATLSGDVREDEVDVVRGQVRERITNDLAPEPRALAGDLAAEHIAPNLTVSEELTEEARRAARAAIAPVEIDITQGERIVEEGSRITPLDIEELEALGLSQPADDWGALVGAALIAIVLSVLMVVFLWRFQPDVWYRVRPLLLFILAVVLSAFVLRVAADRTLWAYVVPTSATVLLVGILLKGYAGAAIAAALALVAGIVNGSSLELAVYVLAGGITSLLAIVHAERLNAFLRAGFVLAATNLAVVTAFSLLSGRDLNGTAQLALAAVVNAGLSVVLAVGSFAVLGNLFGIMTIFQLLELANPSNRLLRRLLMETPGTYHHSVMVGNLAERAAETIGADPLLVRVGAYYHDIGKTKNPLIFIENQAGSHNIHDDLDAETSARIIAAHIRDGIDLGYEHALPVQIIGFIPQHHGTSVMSSFYGKALHEARGNEQLVNKDRFRYPGPRPQSREAAILMLADGVEASVRALDSKEEPAIREMVDTIVDARLEDGQLDDAELTLKNVAQIKEAFVQQLLGMYHARIKYPENVVPLPQRERA